MATIPTPPTLPAGYIVQVADMNALAQTATFALNKPMSRVHSNTTQAITLTTGTAVNYQVVDFDPDGMYASANPGRLTINTPGYWKFRYMCNCGSVGATAYMVTTTGPNNPAGSGLLTDSWISYTLGTGTTGACGASGILPAYLYVGDYVQVYLERPAGTMTTVLTDMGSYLNMEWVSA